MTTKLRRYFDHKEVVLNDQEEDYHKGNRNDHPSEWTFTFLDAFRELENLELHEKKERIKNAPPDNTRDRSDCACSGDDYGTVG